MKNKTSNRRSRKEPVIDDSFISIEDVGDIRMRRSARAKNLRLRIDKEGITAILPVYYPEQAALKFIGKKKNWIARSLAKQKEIQSASTIFTEDSVFNTQHHSLHIAKHSKSTVKSIVGRNKIQVWFPEHASAEDERIQILIRRAIEEAWRVEAKKYLPQKVEELARKHNFTFKKLTFKNAKSRWGSCSAKNNINLNVQLMRLPEHLIDYVILHELVHTKYKHHQSGFWNKLEEVFPGAKKYDKELNKFHLRYW